MTPGEHALALVQQPEWRTATHRAVAEASGATYEQVRSIRRQLGHVNQRTPRRGSLALERLTPRHLALLENIYLRGLRGGDVRALLASDDGRDLRRAVSTARRSA